MTTGKDLLDLGLKPGKWFKDALKHINGHALAGDALHAYLDTVKPAPTIPLLARLMPFHENIRADTGTMVSAWPRMTLPCAASRQKQPVTFIYGSTWNSTANNWSAPPNWYTT